MKKVIIFINLIFMIFILTGCNYDSKNYSELVEESSFNSYILDYGVTFNNGTRYNLGDIEYTYTLHDNISLIEPLNIYLYKESGYNFMLKKINGNYAKYIVYDNFKLTEYSYEYVYDILKDIEHKQGGIADDYRFINDKVFSIVEIDNKTDLFSWGFYYDKVNDFGLNIIKNSEINLDLPEVTYNSSSLTEYNRYLSNDYSFTIEDYIYVYKDYFVLVTFDPSVPLMTIKCTSQNVIISLDLANDIILVEYDESSLLNYEKIVIDDMLILFDKYFLIENISDFE